MLIFSNVYAQTVSTQDNWLHLCPGERFCFRYPAELKVVPVQAIDSLAGQLRSDHLSLVYDLGRYSSSFAELSAHAVIEKTSIDGYAADILITDQVMALRIPKVESSNRFAMQLEFTGTVSVEVGKRIFHSITFSRR